MSTTRIDLKTTIAAQVVMIVFLLLTTVGVAQESLSNDQLQSLPTHVRDYVFPELKVLERTVEKQSELGIIATFRNEHGFPLFNPFGISQYGRPYQIILIDSRWNRVGTVVELARARKYSAALPAAAGEARAQAIAPATAQLRRAMSLPYRPMSPCPSTPASASTSGP